MGAKGPGWRNDDLSHIGHRYSTPRTDDLEGFFQGVEGIFGGIAIGAGVLAIIGLVIYLLYLFFFFF